MLEAKSDHNIKKPSQDKILRRFFYFPYKIGIKKVGFKVAFYATFFLRLCARACNPNSISTFLRDFKVNLLKLWLCFNWANTGSTSQHRFFRFFIPSSLLSSSLAFSLCRSRLWLRSRLRLFFEPWHMLRIGQPSQFFA